MPDHQVHPWRALRKQLPAIVATCMPCATAERFALNSYPPWMLQGSSLPLEVLQQLLAQLGLPYRGRLGTCALVCHSWRAVANAATNIQLQASTFTDARVMKLSLWLSQHGGSVNRLVVQVQQHAKLFSLQLDAAQLSQQLQELALQNVPCNILSTAAGSSSNRSSSVSGACSRAGLAALTGLTRLQLSDTGLELTSSSSLAELSGLTNLRSLALTNVDYWHPGCGRSRKERWNSIFGTTCLYAALKHLVQLTSLTLDCNQLSYQGGTYQPSSSQACMEVQQLTNMQQLRIRLRDVTNGTLAHLPPSINWLELAILNPALRVSRATTPGVAHLTALRHLGLRGIAALEPTLLLNFPQLTFLALADVQSLID